MHFIKTCDERIFNINIISELLIDDVVYNENLLGFRVYFDKDNESVNIAYFYSMEEALKVLLIGISESFNDFSIIQLKDLLKDEAEKQIPDFKSISVDEWVDLLEKKKEQMLGDVDFLETTWLY